MASTDLVLTFLDLYTDVGERINGTRTLSAGQKAEAQRIANRGYMMFLMAWDWEFLEPRVTLSVASAATETTMTANFTYISEPFSYGTGVGRPPLQEVPYTEIVRMRSMNSATTSYPTHYSLQPVAQTTAQVAQTWEASWYGTPSQALTLYFRYRMNPLIMSADTEVPLGGPLHAMTIRQAGLMIAEQEKGQTNGVELQKYEQMFLPRSIERDKRMKVSNIGRMYDPAMTVGFSETWSVERSSVDF